MRASLLGLVCGLAGVALGVVLGAAVGPCSGDGAPIAPTQPVRVEARDGPTAAPASADGSEDEPSREALEAEIAWLRAALDASSRAEPAAVPEEPAEASQEDAEPEAAESFDEDALREAGYAEAEIERLRERWDVYELERLYLTDQARREGWLRSERFRRENRQRYADLQAALGDEEFDATLYAAGQHNRVGVIDVLQGSAAEQAGLQAGDRIVRYDGRRIFDMQALVRATAESEPGTTVEIRYRRDGDERRAFLPAGPIGVRLRPERGAPDTVR